MLRFFLPLALIVLTALPAHAERMTREKLIEQNLAIATSVQEQLLGCWSLPTGFEGRTISVRLAFLGVGTLDNDPALTLDSIREADRSPEIVASIARAIASCLPFVGLEELGARPDERFDITVHFQS